MQRRLRFCHDSVAGNGIEKLHLLEVNLELKPAAALSRVDPAAAPADEVVTSRLEVKVCLGASWLDPIHQRLEAAGRAFGSGRSNLDILRPNPEHHRPARIFSRNRQPERDGAITRFRKNHGIALLL